MNSHEPLPDPLVELIAQRFRVLGEPVRIKLLDALRAGPAGVSELARQLGLSQQNASKHLGVLAAAGLVERTRTGNSALYTISDPTVFALCELVCDALRDRVVAMQAILPTSSAQPLSPGLRGGGVTERLDRATAGDDRVQERG